MRLLFRASEFTGCRIFGEPGGKTRRGVAVIHIMLSLHLRVLTWLRQLSVNILACVPAGIDGWSRLQGPARLRPAEGSGSARHRALRPQSREVDRPRRRREPRPAAWVTWRASATAKPAGRVQGGACYRQAYLSTPHRSPREKCCAQFVLILVLKTSRYKTQRKTTRQQKNPDSIRVSRSLSCSVSGAADGT